ncbi:MAG TPA: hypothetical protein VML55_11670 [Planctomycetaceae bacterium]|nr:hypothetical protein [Planctomycetaceae bacterium]
MIHGFLKLRAAAAHLIGWNGDFDALVEAAERLYAAGYYRESWPAHVKARFERIRYRLFTQGTIRLSLARLPDAELSDLAVEMQRFTTAALSGRTSWLDFTPEHPVADAF